MLPALHLGGTLAEAPAYTRRPQWTQPLESLWGILTKWQFVNRLPYSTIAACVSSLARAQMYEGVDLRVLEAFDLDALAHHSGVPRAALAGGACSASAASSVLGRASVGLRFCGSCMQQGFHATLFQFTAIARCPIHDERLLEACPGCGGRIAYRLDPVFAAHPFACPRCLRPLLADAIVLMQASLDAGACGTLLAWQRFLGRYASWYALGPRGHHAATASLGFIGALQEVVREPPSVPPIGSMRTVAVVSPRPARPADAAFDRSWRPAFTAEHWPHFQARSFVDLCRRYARFHDLHRQHDSLCDRHVTHWWRRSWEGAISRPCPVGDTFEDPPFGIAEWVAFSQIDRHASARTAQGNLVVRFEEDLQLTWDAWSVVVSQVPTSAHAGLHPSLVPPRGCWLTEPVNEPEAPALGFF